MTIDIHQRRKRSSGSAEARHATSPLPVVHMFTRPCHPTERMRVVACPPGAVHVDDVSARLCACRLPDTLSATFALCLPCQHILLSSRSAKDMLSMRSKHRSVQLFIPARCSADASTIHLFLSARLHEAALNAHAACLSRSRIVCCPRSAGAEAARCWRKSRARS